LTGVIVESDESFESAPKRFKKPSEKAGLLSENSDQSRRHS
jgi:ribosomal protein S21